jgi:hypothetical protein
MAATITEPLKIAGAVQVRDPGPDDPPYLIVFHRDIGGDQLRPKHRLNDPDCWCAPLTIALEDSRREVFRQQFEGLKRLN